MTGLRCGHRALLADVGHSGSGPQPSIGMTTDTGLGRKETRPGRLTSQPVVEDRSWSKCLWRFRSSAKCVVAGPHSAGTRASSAAGPGGVRLPRPDDGLVRRGVGAFDLADQELELGYLLGEGGPARVGEGDPGAGALARVALFYADEPGVLEHA